MRSDMSATVQEIIEKSCNLLHVSAIAIYYGDPDAESFTCIAKHTVDPHRTWDYPDQSWRMAEICRHHAEVSKGGYVIYGAGEYIPQMEAIMAKIQSHSMMIYGLRINNEIYGGMILASAEQRSFHEHEISYCTDVAHIIQGILSRKHTRQSVYTMNRNLLQAYNYVKECVFIKETQTGKVLFANEMMENLFGMDVTGMNSHSFLPEPKPTYTREGAQPAGNIKWQSYIQQINRIMDIQELPIEWQNGGDAKLVIMSEAGHASEKS
jgi:transcriptional regulator with GAF, ATPase, and Fis domain